MRGSAASQRADLPEAQLVERTAARQHRRGEERAEGGGDGGARERELDRRRALPPSRRHGVDQPGGERGAEEGEPHRDRGRGDAQRPDRHDDRERGTGVDAEKAVIGERVARESLHHRPGEAESEPGRHAEQRAGQPAADDHERVGTGPGRVGQRIEHHGRGDGARSHHETQQTGHEQHEDGDREAREGAPTPPAGRGGLPGATGARREDARGHRRVT
ncbi:hypothetical protein O159_19750 [Leifsonia xyli subsp. cynodontis DSM 46306]|uniref:Uncharacterized protein n=1 Tax=Leifsonia xyli subsp. cynodontis DSM 46306 TaxID=1389489 RepID=U3P903_LEIXC|nr:hypothetical protein O159_19750 [Leifsonia xyli subsp. cynodontis DSM 46306]